MKRRAQSARVVGKKIGISVKKPELPTLGSENLVNFENVKPVEVNSKRPLTAFTSDRKKQRDDLIKNAFLTGKLSCHLKPSAEDVKGKAEKGVLPVYGEKPKRKNFEEILREAEERVVREAEE